MAQVSVIAMRVMVARAYPARSDAISLEARILPRRIMTLM